MKKKPVKPSALHELNNLLTALGLNSRLLLMECPGDDPRRKDIEELVEIAQQAVRLAGELKENRTGSPA